MSNVFSESDLAILNHIQKQLKENHVPVLLRRELFGKASKLLSHCVLPALCPFGFSPLTFSNRHNLLFLPVWIWLSLHIQMDLAFSWKIPLTSVARTSSQLLGEGACGNAKTGKSS